MWSNDFPTAEKIVKIYNHIKNKKITKFEPSFESLKGLSYLDTEDQYLLEDQIFCFKELEKRGIVSSKPLFSMLRCPSCSFYSFCIRFGCTFCKSSNIIQGTAIEHDSCGNIDFDYTYRKADGSMICGKCDKRLKAVGVDYSKIAISYRCLECKSLHSEIEQQYICLKCTKFFTKDELRLQQLFTFYVDQNKLSDIDKEYTSMSGLASELIKIHIKTALPGYLMGASRIRHEFSLVVFDSKDTPILVVEKIEQIQNDKDIETKILSFIAKCTDTKISSKILVVIPDLNEELKVLATTYGIIVIGSDTEEDASSRIYSTVREIYDSKKAAKLVE